MRRVGRWLSRAVTKNFTERNPVVIGAVAVVIIVAFVVGAITLNKNDIGGGIRVTARFSNAAGLAKGDQVLMAGVPVGDVLSLDQRGDWIYAHLRINGSVQVPVDSGATIEVETLLGQLAVQLQPGTEWSRPLRSGDTITRTTVPVEFQQLENSTGALLAQSNGPALNQLLGDLASVTRNKQTQVAQIIQGLDALTTTVNQRQTQVSELIDASNEVSDALASRDQQLVAAIDHFNVVLAGLSQRRAAISALITNTEQVAEQTSGLVGANRAHLLDLLSALSTDLGVVARHQVDLAQGVSYLASAVQGFSSIGLSGSGDYPNSWANVYTNLIGGGDPVYGNCGYLDAALDIILGPDPLPCGQRSGTDTPTNPSGSSAAARASDTSFVRSPAAYVYAWSPPTSGATALQSLLAPLLERS